MRIPVQSSVLVCKRHRYKFGEYPVMAGDCGGRDYPQSPKPQSAGITSSREFRESSR